MNYLLDTDVVSQMTKDNPDPRVDSCFRMTLNEEMYLSVITIEELREGVELMDRGPKRRALDEWISHELMPKFGNRILPVGLTIVETCAVISARARKSSFNPGAMDALIAATAIANGMKPATLNRRHFERLGVELVEFP